MAGASSKKVARRSAKELLDKTLKSELESDASVENTKEPRMAQIKSNFARNRVISLNNGELVLDFDSKGLADCPDHLLHVLAVEMRFKPNRYTIVSREEPVVSPVEVELEQAIEELASEEAAEAEEPEEPAKAEEPEPEPAEPEEPAPALTKKVGRPTKKRGRPAKKKTK